MNNISVRYKNFIGSALYWMLTIFVGIVDFCLLVGIVTSIMIAAIQLIELL